MEKLNNATYWTVAPEQLGEGESVNYGSAEVEDAQQVADQVVVGTAEVRELTTQENVLPSDHSDFDPSQVFESRRFCVVHRG